MLVLASCLVLALHSSESSYPNDMPNMSSTYRCQLAIGVNPWTCSLCVAENPRLQRTFLPSTNQSSGNGPRSSVQMTWPSIRPPSSTEASTSPQMLVNSSSFYRTKGRGTSWGRTDQTGLVGVGSPDTYSTNLRPTEHVSRVSSKKGVGCRCDRMPPCGVQCRMEYTMAWMS